jgi:hypothetical protein
MYRIVLKIYPDQANIVNTKYSLNRYFPKYFLNYFHHEVNRPYRISLKLLKLSMTLVV